MLPVLTYHAIEDLDPPLGVSRATFEWQMAWLHDHGVRVVSLDAAIAPTHDTYNARRHAVAITFDDGYNSVGKYGLPVLARYGFTASVFCVSGYVGLTNAFPGQPRWVPERRLLDWSALNELRSAEWDIEAHSRSHHRFDRLSVAAIEDDLSGCIDDIAAHTGRAPAHFAYPYGLSSDSARQCVSRRFKSGWTATPGVVTSRSDPHLLPRVDVCDISAEPLFRLLTRGLLAPYLRIRRTARDLGRAIRPR